MIIVEKDFKSIKFKLPVWNSIHPVYKFLNIVVLHVAPDLPEIRVITILEGTHAARRKGDRIAPP